MPFQKGQSGNPGGRPKGTSELAKAARAHTKEAINTLAKILKDKKAPETARISAANSLLDRGYGKPVQAIAGEDGGSAITIIIGKDDESL